MKQGEVRIIAGKWRGRKLRFPAVSQLRPTTDRTRETLFNWLAPYLTGARCLDPFAGSGALGFEALSRGADFVLFLDKNLKIIDYLKSQLALLGAVNAQAYLAKFPSAAYDIHKRDSAPFEIVFLDPPFHEDLLIPSCLWLEEQQWLTDNALIYLETELPEQLLTLPKNWKVIRAKSAGQVKYYLVQRQLDIT